ncbi:tetratricopeptide repeat protein, partial [Escherichia coli]|uniref:tetratricopeptide repeat protein n=1 Tax=Escherichia coli TaxID=562 RepID=UPI00258FF7E3
MAQHSLACMYRDGEGVEVDDEQAFKWCQKSAEQGYAEAQYHLATMYIDGRGVDVDYQQVVFWLNLSAD